MRTNKNTSKIILAITVAILATMISYSAFSNMRNQMQEQQKLIDVMQKTQKDSQEESYAYAVAAADLKAGEIVSDTDVDFKQFSAENKDAFENRSDVVNKVLLKDISIGEEFTTAQIALISNDEVTLREGFRALTLSADIFQGKSETMKQGSSVDIYSTADNSGWDLEGVRIISFESSKNSVGLKNSTPSIMDADSITFEIPVSDLTSFIFNASKNKLMLVERNPNDKIITRKKSKTSYGNYSTKYTALPNLPSAVPITNLGSGGKNFNPDSFSQLPQPMKPAVQPPSVEVIEANVKSKVTFE